MLKLIELQEQMRRDSKELECIRKELDDIRRELESLQDGSFHAKLSDDLTTCGEHFEHRKVLQGASEKRQSKLNSTLKEEPSWLRGWSDPKGDPPLNSDGFREHDRKCMSGMETKTNGEESDGTGKGSNERDHLIRTCTKKHLGSERDDS